MRKLWQTIAIGGAALLLIGLVIAPILIYRSGIPWLPAKPQASDSQLTLVYTIDAPLIGGAIWLLNLLRIYFQQNQRSGSGFQPQAVRLSQSVRVSRYSNVQLSHNDPIVIGGGREKNEGLFWSLVIFGFISAYVGIIVAITAKDQSTTIGGLVFIALGLVSIFVGIILRPYGKRRECLQIGSEGIAYSWKRKDRLFIPWDEMISIYVDISIFFCYLFVVLERNSPLLFQEPIKSKFEAKQGRSGAVVICGVSNSSSAIIPKHLVEKALDIYAPSGIGRSSKQQF